MVQSLPILRAVLNSSGFGCSPYLFKGVDIEIQIAGWYGISDVFLIQDSNGRFASRQVRRLLPGLILFLCSLPTTDPHGIHDLGGSGPGDIYAVGSDATSAWKSERTYGLT